MAHLDAHRRRGVRRTALDNPDLQRLLANVDTRDLLADGPLHRGQSPLRNVPNYQDYVFDIMTTGGEDALWAERGINFEAHYEEMADIPTVYAGSWYDSYGKATVDNLEALADSKESDHFLIMGPWTHEGRPRGRNLTPGKSSSETP